MPTIHHANPEALKDIYVAMGKYAFAISIWQTIGEEKPVKELLTYWSKIWPIHVDAYTEEERYALIIREVLKQYKYFLLCAKAVVFHTSSTSFTTLANKIPS